MTEERSESLFFLMRLRSEEHSESLFFLSTFVDKKLYSRVQLADLDPLEFIGATSRV